MIHLCRHCDEPATRRCSGCKSDQAWYCNETCQRASWPWHIFECNPKKPINTAYHLARAVYADLFPDDPQTLEDYGFNRASTADNRVKLLGLYQGLIKYNGVEPKAVHRWRVKGTLVEEIKAVYEEMPERARGSYYPWFLRNQWVIDRKLPPPTVPTNAAHAMLLQAWEYTGGSSSATLEEINTAKDKWPEHKQECFLLCAMLLSDWHPQPEHTIWLNFGFCVCQNESCETPLAQLYRQLLTKCSFDELCIVYESSRLIALFDAKGLQSWRESILYLDDVLTGSPKVNKSVWDLKQYLATENGPLIPSVGVDYGFFNCQGATERQDLKKVYMEFFADYRADPIELHKAAIGGRLFDYVGGFVELKQKFYRLMNNPYPLTVV